MKGRASLKKIIELLFVYVYPFVTFMLVVSVVDGGGGGLFEVKAMIEKSSPYSGSKKSHIKV